MSSNIPARLRFYCCVLVGFTLTGCVTQRQKNLLGNKAEPAMWHVDGPRKPWFFGRSGRLKNPEKTNLAQGQLQEEFRQYPQAEESYRRVLKENPDSVDAIMGIARINALSGHDQKANEGYQKALRLKPNDPYILDTVAQFYGSKGRWPEAVRLLKASTAAGPNIKTHRFHLAVAMANAGNIQGAMPNFTQTVGQAEAHYNIGYILSTQGKLELAKQHLRMAVTQAPQLTLAQTLLSQLDAPSTNAQAIARTSRPPAQQARMANGAAASSTGARFIRQTARTAVSPAASPLVPGIHPASKMQVIPNQQQQQQVDFGAHSVHNHFATPAEPVEQSVASLPLSPDETASMTAEQLEQWENQTEPNDSTTPDPSSL